MINIYYLAEKLENECEVNFEYDGLVYEIFESSCDDGYIVNVYSEGKEIDGGLCSGSPKDAIEFMLPKKTKEKK